MAELIGEDPGQARAEIVGGGPPATIRISGELDISSVDEVRTVVDSVLAENPRHLVVDMAELEFMDSTGIALLLAAAQSVERLELHNPRATVRRVLEMTGLTQTLVII